MSNLAQRPQILFVYKARSGLMQAAKDYFHKLLHPESYPCSLCALTYDNLGMRSSWRAYVKTLPYTFRFIYEDELKREFPEIRQPLPAILFQNDEKNWQTLISAEELKQQSLPGLIHLLDEKLEERSAEPGTKGNKQQIDHNQDHQ